MEDRDMNEREYRRDRGLNWLWVLVPVALVVGWVANSAAVGDNPSGAQPGVGGGPGVVCEVPTPTS